MQVYTLPKLTEIETRLLRLLKGRAGLAKWKIFSNGEHFVSVGKVPARVVTLGRSHPPAEQLWQTALLVDTLRQNGAKHITLVLPYFGYSRQDRAVESGDSVAATTLTNLFHAAGATHIVTLELHSERVQVESSISLLNISSMQELARAVKKNLGKERWTVVSPDAGGAKRAKIFADTLKLPLCWVEKVRSQSGSVKAKQLHGTLNGKAVILVDDIVDTGSTLKEAVRLLRQSGCTKFYLAVTHPVFSRGAEQLLQKIGFEQVIATNTLPLSSKLKRLQIVDVAPLISQAIHS